MALINHTINQNSIQLSAQTPSKISVSLIIKFRQGLSLFERGWVAAWHCHFRHLGKAISAFSSCSSVSRHCQKQQDGDSCSQQHFSLFSSLCSFHTVYLLLIYFLHLYYFYFFFCSSLFLPSFPLPHHLPSISPSLSCSFPLLPLLIPPSKQGNSNPKEEQELNLCQCNGPRGYIWNQQITEPWKMLVI